MNLAKTAAAILLSCVFGAFAFAQDEAAEAEYVEYEAPNIAIEIDEFGREGECQFSGRVDNFLAQLQNAPSATGYVITYRGTDALPSEYDESNAQRRFANYVRFRNFDASRFVFIDGGFRESEANELWIVPAGAAPPVPSESVAKPELPAGKSFIYDKSYLIQEYGEGVLNEFVLPSVVAREAEEARLAEEEWQRENPLVEAEPPVEETAEKNAEIGESSETAEPEAAPTAEELAEQRVFWISEKFGDFLKNHSEKSEGVIIFYADDARYDIGKLQNFVEQGRDRLAEKAEIPVGKIRVVFGGYRSYAAVEFYVVPEDAEPPTAAPEEREIEETENTEAQQ